MVERTAAVVNLDEGGETKKYDTPIPMAADLLAG
jgi:hypothetical protein